MANKWQPRSSSPSPTYDYSYDYYGPDGGGSDSPMETEQENDEEEVESQMKSSSSLQLMLSAICQERNRDDRPQPLICDDSFLFITRNSFWTDIFERYFVESQEDEAKDDMLFYVRKTTAKSRLNLPQADSSSSHSKESTSKTCSYYEKTEIDVFRKSSPNLPSLGEQQIDWEETVYLNLILQQFEYQVTCAICSRTGEKELQILKKFTQKVYASPSKRSMDSKGTSEEITYPNIFFTVDNFEEAFGDIIVRDSEMVCVELVAKDRHSQFQGVIFLGSIRYDALRKVYDARASTSSKMAQRMSLGWFRGHKRVEYVRMRGPGGKGHAEMAVSRVKGSGPETPDVTPDTENFREQDFENENQYTHRRMSDPSQGWNSFVRGSFKRNGIRKSRSETENVDVIGLGCSEVEAGDIEDEFNDDVAHYNGFFGKSFGQAWHWFKEKKRANCVALHSYLTYITLPWHRIIADVLDARQEPVLAFDCDSNDNKPVR